MNQNKQGVFINDENGTINSRLSEAVVNVKHHRGNESAEKSFLPTEAEPVTDKKEREDNDGGFNGDVAEMDSVTGKEMEKNINCLTSHRDHKSER